MCGWILDNNVFAFYSVCISHTSFYCGSFHSRFGLLCHWYRCLLQTGLAIFVQDFCDNSHHCGCVYTVYYSLIFQSNNTGIKNLLSAFPAIGVLIAVILFPVKFLDDLPFFVFFRFGWGYGIAWAAFFFMLTAAILFLISQDRKEIYRTEKRIVV